MKILFISYTYWPPDFGGELLNALDRLNTLVERGNIVIALTSGRPDFDYHHLDRKIEVFRSPIIGIRRVSRVLRRIVYFYWVVMQLIRMEYDVVHLASVGSIGQVTDALGTWLLTVIVHIKGKRSIYVHSLADTDDNPFVFTGLQRLCKQIKFHYISVIISVSPSLHNEVVKHFPQKAHMIVYGIRDDIYQLLTPYEKEQGRKELGLSENDIVFTYMGSVGTRKGFDLLAQAFSDLAPTHPTWKLWVIGPSTQRESSNISEIKVKEITAPLVKYSDRVRWFGRIDDRKCLSSILSISDVFVFPSRREGMPLSPLEAMSSGLPVILSRIKGVTDLANIEGETGLYISPGNLPELEHAMEILGGSANLRREMGFAGHRIIKDKFSWNPFIDQWESLYLENMGNS